MSSTMTLDQVRDRIAELEGWEKRAAKDSTPEDGEDGFYWTRGARPTWDHPIPPTLDEAAKLPAGYWWERDHRRGVWRGGKVGQDYHLPDLVVKDTGNNVEDLTRLRLLCLEHLKGNA